MSWQPQCRERLVAGQHDSGGWSYQAGREPCSEPTALACLALGDSIAHRGAVIAGLRWLAARQQPDDGVSVSPALSQPCWSTALACLAWTQCKEVDDFPRCARRATNWLLNHQGQPLQPNPSIYGHNTQLIGWSWVDGTHSWIEPTAHAVLALRTAGLREHPRTRQGVSLLLDRALEHGGWNYGNKKMFGRELRPFPAQTGLALAALAGETRVACVDRAIDYLHDEMPRLHTPFSLGWSLIGVTAWNARPVEADEWLSRCADRVARRPPQPASDAMLLLASAESSPLMANHKETAHAT